ncbi:AbrB/MazE/SpoVT family DNA-binding domain-containing protein [Kroppenstedtia eburnea]|uniref:Looped-hinge helix DNA binding domain-containing protein, AbrB family n=1 Tax=Kroppenstedtia eburnea TaxID=714067 RepID=A0A1N7L9X7_9BACL|nr:AbrB/MazE/SpoVT family DNA-binding domain-containing protein [Kroppenstedtia eburnea]SIS70662.1 looped-hinge helix DNA binding domain-containing protein, AbrB family [Kroppenstedtia eburnea]
MLIKSAKFTSKGQITVPKEVRESLGVQEGDKVYFKELPEGGFKIEKADPFQSLLELAEHTQSYTAKEEKRVEKPSLSKQEVKDMKEQVDFWIKRLEDVSQGLEKKAKGMKAN